MHVVGMKEVGTQDELHFQSIGLAAALITLRLATQLDEPVTDTDKKRGAADKAGDNSTENADASEN